MADPLRVRTVFRRADEQRSLLGEMLDWMLAPLMVVWPMSIALTWVVAQGIANRPYDRGLGERLWALARQVEIAAPARVGDLPRVQVMLSDEAAALLRIDGDTRVSFQILGARGELLMGDRELAVPEQRLDAQIVHYRDETLRDEPVRVAWLWLPAPRGATSGPDGGALIQVAETLEERRRLATEIIKGVILPQFVILPVAVLLLWFALENSLKPLTDLQRRIRRRDAGDLSPIGRAGVPEEVVPLVGAIDDLLARLDQSIGAQKHFLADAAHQLKTPLAGLRTQAEVAERELDSGRGDSAGLKRSLQQIALSSQRTAHMVNQLLAMARAEDREQALRMVDTDLAALTREAVLDFLPRAQEKAIDLGYEGPEPGEGGRLRAQPVLLRELIRNLVDNALQYTPRGGVVTARVRPDPSGRSIALEVEDDGPGIAPSERERVFRPFYRALGTQVEGSGLGLAIVHEIAQQHGAVLSVDDARPREAEPARPGARFTVRFPLAPGGLGV